MKYYIVDVSGLQRTSIAKVYSDWSISIGKVERSEWPIIRSCHKKGSWRTYSKENKAAKRLGLIHLQLVYFHVKMVLDMKIVNKNMEIPLSYFNKCPSGQERKGTNDRKIVFKCCQCYQDSWIFITQFKHLPYSNV